MSGCGLAHFCLVGGNKMDNYFEEIDRLMREIRGGSKYEPIHASLEAPRFLVHPSFLDLLREDSISDQGKKGLLLGCVWETNWFMQKSAVFALNESAKEIVQNMKIMELLESGTEDSVEDKVENDS